MWNPSIKTQADPWLGTSPLVCMEQGPPQDHTPPSRGTREVSSPQAPPLLLSTELLADQGQQQDDLSFPQAQRVVSQHRGGNGGMVGSDLPPAIRGCSWVTLGLRSYSALHQIFTPLEKGWGKNLYGLSHSATMIVKEIIFRRMEWQTLKMPSLSFFSIFPSFRNLAFTCVSAALVKQTLSDTLAWLG